MARRRNDAFSIKFESHGIAHEVRACVLHTFRHTEEKKGIEGGVRRAPNHATTVRYLCAVGVGGVRSGQVKKRDSRRALPSFHSHAALDVVHLLRVPSSSKKILSPSFDKNGIRGECRNYA